MYNTCLIGMVLFACYIVIESGSPSTLDYFWSPDNGVEIKKNEKTDTEYGYTLDFTGSNGISREETVSWVGKDFKIDGVISFIAEDSLIYNLLYRFDNGQYNITVDSYPIRRIPPGALKSLVG